MAIEVTIDAAVTGETGAVIDLIAIGTDVVSANDLAASEETNNLGTYKATTTVSPGNYYVLLYDSSDNLLAKTRRYIGSTDGIYSDEPAPVSDLIQFETTVAVVNSQTDFDLNLGPDSDGGIDNRQVWFYDSASDTEVSYRSIVSSLATNANIVIDNAPDFTVVAGDKVIVTKIAASSTVDNEAIADAVWQYDINTPTFNSGEAGELMKWLRAMTEDDGEGARRWTPKALSMAPAGGGGFVRGAWGWDTDTAATDPGSGDVKADNATLASITNIYVNEVTGNGFNGNLELSALKVGDGILLVRDSAASNFVRGTISSAPVDNDGWWTIPITVNDSNGSFGNNNSMTMELQYKIEPPDAVVIAQAVWDRVLSGNHDLTDSAGEIMQDLLQGVEVDIPQDILDLNDITVADILDVVLSGNHDVVGSIGRFIQDIALDTNTLIPSSIAGVQTTANSILDDTENALPALISDLDDDIVALTGIVNLFEIVTAQDMRDAIGMATANMDAQLTAILNASAPTAIAVADAVWNRALVLHTQEGSAGRALSDSAANSPSAEDIRIEMDTNSAALTNIFNIVDNLEDLSAAEAKSEVADALADIYLDRLLAVAYDALDKPGAAGAILNAMLEDGSGLARFTAAALTNAPTGSGGSGDWTTTEREQIRWLLGIDGTAAAPITNTPNIVVANDIPTVEEIRIEIDDNSTSIAAIPTTTLSEADVRNAVGLASANLDTQLAGLDTKLDGITTAVVTDIPALIGNLNDLDAAGIRSAVGLASPNLDAQLAALGQSLGAGANTVTITIQDTAFNPLENVSVRLQEGATVVFGLTDASGQVTFALDDATYTLNTTKPGYTPITGGSVVVSGATTDLHTMAVSGIVPPTEINTSVGVMDVYDENAVLEGDVWFTVRLADGPGIPGQSHDTAVRLFQADGNGFLQVTGLVIGASYTIHRGVEANPNGNPPQTFVVPNQPSFDLPAGVLGFE